MPDRELRFPQELWCDDGDADNTLLVTGKIRCGERRQLIRTGGKHKWIRPFFLRIVALKGLFSVSLSVSFCLFLSLSVCLSLSLGLSVSLCLSLPRSICVCLSLFVSTWVCLSVFLTLCICLFPLIVTIVSSRWSSCYSQSNQRHVRNTTETRHAMQKLSIAFQYCLWNKVPNQQDVLDFYCSQSIIQINIIHVCKHSENISLLLAAICR